MENPFADLAPKEEQQNPFADLSPSAPKFADLSQDETALRPREDKPDTPDFDEYGMPTAAMVDRRLSGITQNRDKAANILAMSQIYKRSPAFVNDHYDEMNELRDQPEAYRFIPRLAIAGGMMAAPISATIKGVEATIPFWKYLLGFAAFEAEENVNALVRSRIEGTPFKDTKPYSFAELAPETASGVADTLFTTLDFLAKGAALHAGYKGGLKPLWEHMARETIEQHSLPGRIYVDPQTLKGMEEFRAPADQAVFWKDLGVSEEEIAVAMQHGLQVEVPSWKLTTVADKPWWAKVKGLLRLTPYEETFAEPAGSAEGRVLGGLLGEPGKAEPAKAAEPKVPQLGPEAPDVDRIAQVIKQMESNGDYGARSRDGGVGAYQFTGTWEPWSSEYNKQILGGSGALPMTPENQDAVARWKIQGLIDQGYSPQQIASIWNSGSPEWLGKVGTNKAGVRYDVPAYVEKFAQLYGEGGTAGKPFRPSLRSTPIDMGKMPGLTTESLLDGMARGNVDFALVGMPEENVIKVGEGFIPVKASIETPIEGPTGAQIVGYEWRSKMGTRWSEGRQEDIEARVSDWDASDRSTGSGREIVHVFYVAHPDGTVTSEGIGSAQNILGIKETKLKSIAQKERESRAYQEKLDKQDLEAAWKAASDTRQQAARKYRMQNASSPMRSQQENDRIFFDSVLFEKDGKFIRRPKELKGKMITGGWQEISPVSMDLSETQGAPNANLGNQVGNAVYLPATPEQIGNIEESLIAELGEELRGTIRAPESISPEHQRAGEFAQRLGLAPVFFECSDPDMAGVGGFTLRDNPGTVYLHSASWANPVYTVLHEKIHSLSASDSEAYGNYETTIMGMVGQDNFSSYQTWLDAVRNDIGAPLLTASKMQEEFVADLTASVLSGDLTKLSASHLDVSHMVADLEAAKQVMNDFLGVVGSGTDDGISFDISGKSPTYDEIMAEASRRAHAVIEERILKDRRKLESQLRKQAEVMIDEDPVQQTIKEIVALRGFSPAHLKKLGYGQDMISNLRAVHRGLVTKNGKAIADEIAMDKGLWDGSDAMLEAIINSAGRKEAVDRITRGLLEEHKTEREINAADTYGELLDEEIKIFEELTKGSTEAWENKPTPGIKRSIDELVGVKRVAETEAGITEYDALKAAMKKASTAARQAYSSGKKTGALSAKLKERQVFQLYKANLEARRIVERTTKALRKAVRIPANELKAGGIKPEYRDVIHSILSPFHKELNFNPVNPSGMTHAQFLQHMDDSGELTIHDPDRINAFTRKPWRELTINELREIKGSIGEVVYLGKREGKIELSGKKQDLRDLVRSLAKTIYETSGKRGINLQPTPQEVLEAKDRGESSTPSLFQRYGMSRRKVEFLCRDLDGWVENGPVHQAVFQPIADAEAKQIIMTQEKAAALESVFKAFSDRIGGKKLSKWLNEKVVVPGLGKIFTRHRLMMVYLNSGNDGNLKALRSIFTQDEIDAINATFTSEDKAFFNDLHALVDSLFGPLSEVYRAMTGARLKKVEGRYWPIVLDSDMSMKAEKIKTNESQKDLFSNVFTAPSMKHGFEIERKGTKLPPKLDLSVLFQHLEQVVHRITHAEAVRTVQKIVTHEDFKGAVIATRGRAFYDQFMPWLQYVANPRKDTSISVWDRGADVLRRNATLNLLGYSISTVMKSVFDWTVVIPEVGAFDTLHGFFNYLRAPRETVAFVNSMSPEMSNFKHNFDRELGALYEKIIPTMNPVKRKIMESAFSWLGMVEGINRYPVWLEAYLQATEGRGKWKGNPLPSEEAARWADQVIRRVKAQAAPKDMAEITRGRGMQRLLTMFYTEASKIDNLLTEYWQRVRHDSGYSYFQYANALFWILVAGPILTEALIRRRPPKDIKEVGADMASMYFGRFPYIRDIVQGALTGFGYNATPATKGAESMVSAIRGGYQALAGKKKLSDERKLGIAVNAADAFALLNPGAWGGFPTRQMITFLKGLADLQSGRAKTLSALYDRQAEKRRREDLKAGIR